MRKHIAMLTPLIVMNDTLTGGNKADELYGMGGNDILIGGKGNDWLEGGKGSDTYKYTNGGTNQDGLDTILDSDGQGSIQIDGQTIYGGTQYGDNHVFRGTDANGVSHLYTFVTGDRTTGNDTILGGAGEDIINGDGGNSPDSTMFKREKHEAANDEQGRMVA